MILCKYFDKYGLDVLRNLRLKVSDPSKFNDPFENSPYIEGEQIGYGVMKRHLKDSKTIDRLYQTHRTQIGGKNKREFKRILRAKMALLKQSAPTLSSTGIKETFKKFREDFLRICRVLCFSRIDKVKPQEEILMWSHYAKGHSGVRIFFDTERFQLQAEGPFEVEYQADRIELELNKLALTDSEVLDKVSRALTVKSLAWKYECEYRWLIRIDECFAGKINGQDYDFIKICPEAITRIDIGMNSYNDFKEQVIKLAKSGQFSHVDIRIAIPDEKKFQLNYNKL